MPRERPAWLVRLVDEIKRRKATDGDAYRQIAMSTGLGVNYVSQLTQENWREPSFGRVVKLCRALNLSITYLVTGADMTAQEEQILAHLRRLDDQQRTYLEGLLESLLRDRGPTQ
jgi:transcriptional regulator with XRE-family HTH domain